MQQFTTEQICLLDRIARQAEMRRDDVNGNHFCFNVHDYGEAPYKILDSQVFQTLCSSQIQYFVDVLEFRSLFDIQKTGTNEFKDGLRHVGFDFYSSEICNKLIANSLCCAETKAQLRWVHLCWLMQEFLTQIYAGGVEDILRTIYWSANALNKVLPKEKAIPTNALELNFL